MLVVKAGVIISCVLNIPFDLAKLVIGPLLDDRLKKNLKNPETLKGCPLYSLSCLSVCLSACDLQSTPFGLET